MYHFTKLAIELNEKEDGVAPTDARNRPDQRYMEDGNWDDANKTKVLLEEKQRAKRKKMEAEAEEAMKKGMVYNSLVNSLHLNTFTRRHVTCTCLTLKCQKSRHQNLHYHISLVIRQSLFVPKQSQKSRSV